MAVVDAQDCFPWECFGDVRARFEGSRAVLRPMGLASLGSSWAAVKAD
jgi:hypothetical protein